MDIVPINKYDDETCDILQNTPDDAVKARLPELLEWLQDINWPVAPLVAERIKRLVAKESLDEQF